MLADIAVVDPDLTMTVPRRCHRRHRRRRAGALRRGLHQPQGASGDRPLRDRRHPAGRPLSAARGDGRRGSRSARRACRWRRSMAVICLGPVNTDGRACRRLSARHPASYGAWPRLRGDLPAYAGVQHAGGRRQDRRRAACARLAGARRSAAAFDAAYRYCADLGIEMRLSALGVPKDDLGVMADEAHAIRRLLDNNPRDLSRDEILKMYETAF